MADIEFPAIDPQSIDWWPDFNTIAHASPLSRDVQVAELIGARWRCQMSFDKLTEAKWRKLTAFITKMRGRANTTLLAPPHAKNARGAVGGAPKVAGGAQVGTSLNTDGWPASTLVLLEGDFFGYAHDLGYSLHQVAADVTSDGTGAAAITFEPAVRVSPADNADIVVSSPVCRMMFVDDQQGRLTVRPPVHGNLTLEFMESFT